MTQAFVSLWGEEPADEPESQPVDGRTKRCKHCKRILPVSAFYDLAGQPSRYGTRHRLTRDGLSVACKDCHAQMARASYIRRVYGITKSEYETLLAAQGGVCAICGGAQTELINIKRIVRQRDHRRNMDALFIDHDHASGKVRGLLCHHCNAGIGHFLDNPDLMRRAIAYIEGKNS